MNLINCVDCGNVCMETPAKICPACVRAEEDAEDKVAQFLRDVDKASLDEIHEATGVKHNIILRMLKRGRIQSDAVISYPCETCGKMIASGRVCDDCSKNIVSQIKTEEWKPQARPESVRKDERLYIKDMIKGR